jgi:hypothetical protein
MIELTVLVTLERTSFKGAHPDSERGTRTMNNQDTLYSGKALNWIREVVEKNFH